MLHAVILIPQAVIQRESRCESCQLSCALSAKSLAITREKRWRMTGRVRVHAGVWMMAPEASREHGKWPGGLMAA